MAYFEKYESGFFTVQSTQPQMIGYALADSPAGQLAWIVQILYEFTDNNGSRIGTFARQDPRRYNAILADQYGSVFCAHLPRGCASCRQCGRGAERRRCPPAHSMPISMAGVQADQHVHERKSPTWRKTG